jgi:hypothetical protein
MTTAALPGSPPFLGHFHKTGQRKRRNAYLITANVFPVDLGAARSFFDSSELTRGGLLQGLPVKRVFN